jgi:peptidoglycan/LPS O-acetylase OafA/YrhL
MVNGVALLAVVLFRQHMGRLTGLDALRGVAALMVFVHHLSQRYGGIWPTAGLVYGVDVFFVLSGFVMARTYEARMHMELSPRHFIGLRYRRLWFPLALGSISGFAVLGVLHGFNRDLIFALGAILLFLPAPWLSQGPFAINVPAWSLFVEIVCNGLHVVLFSRASNLLLLGIFAVCAAAFLDDTFLRGHPVWGDAWATTLLTIPRGVSAYVAGILVYRRYGDEPLGRSPTLGVVALPFVLWYAQLLPPVAAAALVPFVIAPLMLRLSLGLPDDNWARWLGLLSYPLYAVHVPIIDAFSMLGPFGNGMAAVVAAIGVALFYEARRPSSRKANSAISLEHRGALSQ